MNVDTFLYREESTWIKVSSGGGGGGGQNGLVPKRPV